MNSKLRSSADVGALRVSRINNVIDLSSIQLMIYANLQLISMKTGLFVVTNGVTPDVYPGQLAWYLYITLLHHIKKTGMLTGQSQYTIPDCSEFSIPVMWGKYLEGFSRCEEDGVQGFSVYTPPATLLTMNVGYNYPDVNDSLFAALPSLVASQYKICPLIQGGVSIEYAMQADNTLTTVQSFLNNNMALISEHVAALAGTTMFLRDVPVQAPDCSFHAQASSQLVSGAIPWVPPPLGTYFKSPFRNFNPEVSMLYTAGRVLLTVPAVGFRRPAQCGMTWVNNTPSFLIPFLVFAGCWWTSPFKAGPLLGKRGTTKMCALSLKTFNAFFFPISSEAIGNIALQWYRQLRINATGANDGSSTINLDSNQQFLVQFVAYFQMICLRRLNVTGFSFIYDTISRPQAYYADTYWDTVTLPAVAADFVNMLGPTVNDFTPIIPVIVGVNQVLGVTGNLWNSFQAGVAAQNPVDGFFHMPVVFAATPSTILNISLSGNPINAAFKNNNSLITSTLGANVLAPDLVANVLTFTNINTAGQSNVPRLVHIHKQPCGSLALFNSFNRTILPGISYIPLLPDGYFPVVGVFNRVVTGILSVVQCNQVDMVKILAYNIISATTPDFNNIKFQAELPGDVSVFPLLQSLFQETYSQGSPFGATLSLKEKEFVPVVNDKSYAAILYSKQVEDCYWAAIYNYAIGALAPVVAEGSRYAIDKGISMLKSYIGSRLGAEGNDVPKPVTNVSIMMKSMEPKAKPKAAVKTRVVPRPTPSQSKMRPKRVK
jgi:hypothetical protein